MAAPNKLRIAKLDILWWGVSIGGEHYSARLQWYDTTGKYSSIELQHPLSTKEAIYLNKKAGTTGWSRYKKGDPSGKFETRKQLYAYAKRHYKQLAVGTQILVEGGGRLPDYIVDGPADRNSLKNTLNKLIKLFWKRGGYSLKDEIIADVEKCWDGYCTVIP